MTTIDFLKWRRLAVGLSLVVILGAGLAVARQGGPSLGIDFAGGVNVVVRFPDPVELTEVRSALSSDLTDAVVQRYGAEADQVLLVRTPLPANGGAEALEGQVAAVVDALDRASLGPVEVEGRALLTLCGFDLSLNVVAALLTITGYSINDTIVVFDRVRENLRRRRPDALSVVINASVNQTLSRTLITTGTTLFTVVALLVAGGGGAPKLRVHDARRRARGHLFDGVHRLGGGRGRRGAVAARDLARFQRRRRDVRRPVLAFLSTRSFQAVRSAPARVASSASARRMWV